MVKIAEQIGGEGGGHAGAAGWTGNVDRITAESSFISNVAKIPRACIVMTDIEVPNTHKIGIQMAR